MRVLQHAARCRARHGACRSDTSTGGSRIVDVLVLAGDQPEPGAGVISHTADGSLVDQTVADAVGRAAIGVDDDSLVTVVPAGRHHGIDARDLGRSPRSRRRASQLTMIGPDRTGPPALIVGVLELDGPNLAGATYFDVDVGCATVRLTKLPEFIDIGACSLGSDTSLDVLVRGYHDAGGDPPAPVLDGYAAGRAVMSHDHAILDLPAWQTTGTAIPVTLTGVTPLLSWTLSPTMPFAEGRCLRRRLSTRTSPSTRRTSSRRSRAPASRASPIATRWRARPRSHSPTPTFCPRSTSRPRSRDLTADRALGRRPPQTSTW